MGKLKAKIQSMPKEVKSSMAYTVCSAERYRLFYNFDFYGHDD